MQVKSINVKPDRTAESHLCKFQTHNYKITLELSNNSIVLKNILTTYTSNIYLYNLFPIYSSPQ